MKTNRIEFPFDKARAHNAVLWLVERHGGLLNKLSLLKLVFLADFQHLMRYGRPIVGGTYVSMEHGPVASEMFDDLKIDGYAPFELVDNGETIKALTTADVNELAESDIEILGEVDAKYGALEPYTLCDMTHDYEAWRNNYRYGTAHLIPYEDFFLDEPGNDDLLECLRDDQEAWKILR